MKAAIFFSAIFQLFLLANSLAQAGTFDPDFGNGGVVRTSFGLGTSSMEGEVIAVQPDGKIVVAGAYNSKTYIGRLHPDGSIDTSFGDQGKTFSDLGFDFSRIRDLAILPNGKILAITSGQFNLMNERVVMVLRYNPDGTFDSGFGEDGVLTVQTGSFSNSPYALVVQPDGKFLIAVYVTFPQIGSLVIRMEADGEPDPTYGDNGKALIQHSGGSVVIRELELQPDGKIVAGGFLRISNIVNAPLLARLESDGSPDASFGTDGIAILPGMAESSSFLSISLQPDGKIVGTGVYDLNFLAARCLVNGSLDNSFSEDGILVLESNIHISAGLSVVMQPDGRILAAGYRFQGNTGGGINDEFILMRLGSDGTYDDTFSGDGVVYSSIGTGGDRAQDVVMQPDGKILVTGYARDLQGNRELAVVRYLSGLSVDAEEGLGPDYSMSLSPNPAPGATTLYLELPPGAAAAVRVYDLTGRQLDRFPIVPGTGQLVLPQYAPGLYLVSLVVGGKAVRTEKLVQQ